MKYLLAIVLNLFYVICYEIHIPAWIVFFTTFLLLIIIYCYAIKTNSKIGALLELLCFTLPFAWRSIFGTSFDSFPLCWYYIVGLFLFLKLILSKNIFNSKLSKDGVLSIFCIIFLMFFGIIPLIKSYKFSEGLSEYFMYAFFYAIIFGSIFHEGNLTQENKCTILKSFVYSTLYCSIMITIQFILSKWGINILKNEIFGSTNVRYAYGYMFEDMSSASIYLVSGAMLCILYGKKLFKHPYVVLVTIIVGTTLSSTRTGIVTFIAIVSIYTLISKKSNHKIFKLFTLLILIILITQIYNIIRPMSSITKILTYDNGRFQLLRSSIELFFRYPIFGIGFDKSAFLLLTGSVTIVHTYIMTVLNMTGFIYTTVFVSLIILTIFNAKKKKNIEEIWILLLCFFGSMFIPNLMGVRFLVILFSLIFLSETKKEKK